MHVNEHIESFQQWFILSEFLVLIEHPVKINPEEVLHSL